MEQFSFDSQADFQDWKDAIEKVLGIGGVEELLSEDEELDGGIEGVCVCVCVGKHGLPVDLQCIHLSQETAS